MSENLLAIARGALGDARAWLVGGVVRDRMLGRATTDLDIAIAGDVEAAARTLARAARAAVFPLSEDFGAWRVVAPRPVVAGRPLAAARRDDRARPRAARLHDQRDRRAARGRRAGRPDRRPGGPRGTAAADGLPGGVRGDPLRVLRLPRFACELGFGAEPATVAPRRGTRRGSAGRGRARLRRAQADRRLARPAGRARADGRVGAVDHVLPELAALRGHRAERLHHLDVYDHTLAVLAEAVALERDPVGGARRRARRRRRRAARRAARRRADARRRAALRRAPARRRQAADARLHDEGRVSFWHHDAAGRRALARRPRAAARERAAARARRRAHAPSPAARLPRARAPAAAARRVPLPEGVRARRGRRHAAVASPTGSPRAGDNRRGDRERTSSSRAS